MPAYFVPEFSLPLADAEEVIVASRAHHSGFLDPPGARGCHGEARPRRMAPARCVGNYDACRSKRGEYDNLRVNPREHRPLARDECREPEPGQAYEVPRDAESTVHPSPGSHEGGQFAVGQRAQDVDLTERRVAGGQQQNDEGSQGGEECGHRLQIRWQGNCFSLAAQPEWAVEGQIVELSGMLGIERLRATPFEIAIDPRYPSAYTPGRTFLTPTTASGSPGGNQLRTLILIMVTATMVLVPAATANWKVGGSNEPDTAYDTSSQMWADPTETAQNMVYFNVWGVDSVVGVLNPNVAMTGTAIRPAMPMKFTAVLAIWKDCNGDKYMGHGEAGLLEYPVALYAADALAGVGEQNCAVGPFNDGSTVREVLWISGDEAPATPDPAVVYAPGTAIWGDWGLPGDHPSACAATQASTYVCPSQSARGGPRVAPDHVFHFSPRGTHGAPLPSWQSASTYAHAPQSVDAGSLAPDGAAYVTFYARVGERLFWDGALTPSGGASTPYGSQPCGSNQSIILNGWDCNPAHWLVDCAARGVAQESCIPVGSQYHLRDVDCYDGTILRGSEVRVSAVDFAARGPCASNPGNKADIS